MAETLPAPVTVEQMYLAAILDELRQLRVTTQPPQPVYDPDGVDLREMRATPLHDREREVKRRKGGGV